MAKKKIAFQGEPGAFSHAATHALFPRGEAIPCTTFEEILSETTSVDLLLIDTEGYDLELLKLFDFDRFQPAIVRFEHDHLSRPDWDEAVELLYRSGYRTLREEYDTTGYRAPPTVE